jgi:hypothetical protein
LFGLANLFVTQATSKTSWHLAFVYKNVQSFFSKKKVADSLLQEVALVGPDFFGLLSGSGFILRAWAFLGLEIYQISGALVGLGLYYINEKVGRGPEPDTPLIASRIRETAGGRRFKQSMF